MYKGGWNVSMDFKQDELCTVKRSSVKVKQEVYNFETYCKAMKTISFKSILSLVIGILITVIEWFILASLTITISKTLMEVLTAVLLLVDFLCIAAAHTRWFEAGQVLFENIVIKPLIESESPGAYYSIYTRSKVEVLYDRRVLRTRDNIDAKCTVELPKESMLIRSVETYDRRRRKGRDKRIVRFKGVVLSAKHELGVETDFSLHITSYSTNLFFDKINGEFAEPEEGDIVMNNPFGLSIMTSDVDIASKLITEDFMKTILNLQKMFHDFSCVVCNNTIYVAIDTKEFWLYNTIHKNTVECVKDYIEDQKFKLEYSIALCNKLRENIGVV